MNLEDLKLSDLYVECKHCGGTGRYQGPPQEGDDSRALEVDRECKYCKDKGGTITPAGHVVLNFLRKAKRTQLF